MILGKCDFCSRPLVQSARGRDKKFCDEKCRMAMRDEGRKVARDERNERDEELVR